MVVRLDQNLRVVVHQDVVLDIFEYIQKSRDRLCYRITLIDNIADLYAIYLIILIHPEFSLEVRSSNPTATLLVFGLVVDVEGTH